MGKTVMKETEGTIVEVQTTLDEKIAIGNGKWAIISYVVDDFTYISKKSISVPMYSQVGDTIRIKYDEADPTKIKKAFPRLGR